MSIEEHHEMIYEAESSDTFFSPFSLRAEPMERLLLINWKDGRYYKGAEPQYFDDEMHGKGLLVIMYRLDNKVDVYHEPQLRLEAKGYEIQSGLGQMVACDFERAHLEIGEQGVDADIAFTDTAGRPIVLRVCERRGKRAGNFSLLAPMGLSIDEPEAMPLLFLYDFSFVKRSGTEVTVTVDGIPCNLVRLPVPMGGSRVYLTRYCGDPFIAFWNPEYEGSLTAAEVSGGMAQLDGVRYALVRNKGHNEIAAMACGQEASTAQPARELRITFDPPFPEVLRLRDEIALEGTFRAGMVPTAEAGEVGGDWQVRREGHFVHVRVHPGDGWKSGERSLMPRLIFAIVRPFTQWPKSYEWTATIDLSAEGSPAIASRWQRV